MYCSKCGAQNVDGSQYCVSCGVTLEQSQPQYQQSQYSQSYQSYQQPVYGQPDAYGNADPRDIQDNKVMAVLSYIIFFIPLIVGTYKTSPFTKFHSNQGTALAICAIAYSIAYSIVSFVLAFIPILGWIVIAALGLVSLVFLVFAIIGIVSAVSGTMTKLPLIGNIKILK